MTNRSHTTLDDCRIIELPKIEAKEGNLTAVYGSEHVPFDIARVYYLYDVPGGAQRGGHAHRELEQLMVAVMGSFDAVLDDGKEKRRFVLNRSYFGLYIPPYIWRELENFSSGANCLVLASRPYAEEEYIRDYGEFLKAKGAQPGT